MLNLLVWLPAATLQSCLQRFEHSQRLVEGQCWVDAWVECCYIRWYALILVAELALLIRLASEYAIFACRQSVEIVVAQWQMLQTKPAHLRRRVVVKQRLCHITRILEYINRQCLVATLVALKSTLSCEWIELYRATVICRSRLAHDKGLLCIFRKVENLQIVSEVLAPYGQTTIHIPVAVESDKVACRVVFESGEGHLHQLVIPLCGNLFGWLVQKGNGEGLVTCTPSNNRWVVAVAEDQSAKMLL